jgi:hypothetical protein
MMTIDHLDLTIPDFLRRRPGEVLAELKVVWPAPVVEDRTPRGRPLGYMSEEAKALKKLRTAARISKMLVRYESRVRDLSKVRWDGRAGRFVDIAVVKVFTQEDMMQLDLTIARTGPEWVKLWNSMVLTAVDLGITGHEVVHKFADKEVARKRCLALHGLIQKANGAPKESLLHAAMTGKISTAEALSKVPPMPRSPGFARLKAHPDAEKIRQKTVKEQKAARKAVSGAAPKEDLRRITVLREQNPCRGKAKARFAKYRTGMTVEEYAEAVIAAGLGDDKRARRDVRWDCKRRFISAVK